MIILLIILLLMAVLLVTIMIVPFCYSFSGYWQDTLRAELDIKMGIVRAEMVFDANNRFRVSTLGFCLAEKRLSRGENRGKTKERKKEPRSLADIVAFMDRAFVQSLLHTIVKTIRMIAPQTMEARGVLGFDDPYYTGLLASLRCLLPQIDIKPDFTRQIRDISFSIKGRIIILKVLYYALRFIFSRETRLVMKKARQWKKSRKNATRSSIAVYR